jgi:hypothetical protein
MPSSVATRTRVLAGCALVAAALDLTRVAGTYRRPALLDDLA